MPVDTATDWRAEARAAATRHGVDPDLFVRLIGNESAGNANAVSPKGAVGAGQLMAGTARDMGVTDRTNLTQNLDGSARYLKQQLDEFGDVPRAVAAYNAGPGAVRKYGGVPPFEETRNEVARVAGGGTVADLGRKVKAKYPAYEKWDDVALGRAIRAKYPAYSRYTDVPDSAAAPEASAAPAASQPPPQNARTALASLRAGTTPVQAPVDATPPDRRFHGSLPRFGDISSPGVSQARDATEGVAEQFVAGAAGALPSFATRAPASREPSGLAERAARTAGGLAGFSAVAIPVGLATEGLGLPALAAGALGAGVAGGAAAGTVKERIASGATMAAGSAATAGLTAGVSKLVMRHLATAAPQVARALGQEFSQNVAAAMKAGATQPEAEAAAQKIFQQKVTQASAAALAKASAMTRGASAVAGAGTFGVAQPYAERSVEQALGERRKQAPTPEEMVGSGLELLALNLVLEGRGIARGVRAKGPTVGEPGTAAPFTAAEGLPAGKPAPARPPGPTPEETEAIRKNIVTPPELAPHRYDSSKKAGEQLGATLDEIQKRGPMGFRIPGLEIADAHIVPNLVRVFQGVENEVRVTVLDKATGKIHAIALPNIDALRKAIAPPVTPVQKAPPAAPKPGPPPKRTPEEYAADQERRKSAAAGIEALERQIAENPTDKRVARWKRRLEKLKGLPPPEPEPVPVENITKIITPGPADKPAPIQVEPAPPAETRPAPAPVAIEKKAGTEGPVPATGEVVRVESPEPARPEAPPRHPIAETIADWFEGERAGHVMGGVQAAIRAIRASGEKPSAVLGPVVDILRSRGATDADIAHYGEMVRLTAERLGFGVPALPEAGREKPSEATKPKGEAAPQGGTEAPPATSPAPAPKPPAKPKEPKAPAGKFERGDRVLGATGSSRNRGGGFVLETRSSFDPVLKRDVPSTVSVRWDDGIESTVPPKDLRARAGHRATEAEVARMEEVGPYRSPVSYQPGVKGSEPEPRPAVEADVVRAVRKRAGFRSIDETTLKPKQAFTEDRASSDEAYLTDGHVLFMVPAMDAKVRESLHERSPNKGPEAIKHSAIEQVVRDATVKPQVRLVLRGVTTVGDEQDRAVFHDPKSDRLVVADPQLLKLAMKAVSPDAYEQRLEPRTTEAVKGKPTVTPAEHSPIVMKRAGKVVGVLMPLRADTDATEIRDRLAPELVTHAHRPGPGGGGQVGPTPARGRGIPIARTAPQIPTPAQAAALPGAAVPPLPAQSKAAGLGEKAADWLHELVAATNPVRYAVGPNLDMLQEAKGSLKQALFRTEQAQDKVRKFWDGQSKAQVMDFWDRFESGAQPDPHLAQIADMYRDRANNMFRAISRYKAVPYWDNWFPHMWKDQKKATAYFHARRPMEGRKSFLKKRVFEDIRSGILAGLEPASWNPEELMQAAEHSARKYVMVQELLKDYLASGAMVLVRVGQKPPEHYRKLNQNWARLYLNPEIEIQEYFDKRVMDTLNKVARDIGASTERKMKLGGKMLGYSKSAPGIAGEVVTKFATPESVLAHEIGHAIDARFGMQAFFLRAPVAKGKGSGKINAERIRMMKEFRALADLRFEGQPASPGYKAYVRSAPEKMAVMLEALIHTPEEFKRVAPTVHTKLLTFLALHPALRPLVDLRPGLVYEPGTGTVSAGGVVLGGDYMAEENLARLLDNHMSRDLIAETTTGRALMDSRNTLNAINLGLSAFHATGTTLLSVMSRMGVGLSELAHGHIGTGLSRIATSPAAPLIYARDGWKFYRGDPELVKIEKDLFTGGAALENRAYYRNQMLERFVRNARRAMSRGTPYERLGGASKAVAQAPFAAIELPMRVLTSYYIPQMKIGAFRDLFSSQLRIKAKDLAAGRTTKADVARIAWRDIEDRMGLINYDNEYWDNTLKAAIMVLIRAPGWTLGTLRALGGAAFADLPRAATSPIRGKAPEWTSRMSFALSMVFVTMGASAIYQLLHTGKSPESLEDYLHPRNGLRDRDGKEERVDFPTFMKDVKAWSTDPVKAAVGRIQHGGGASSLGHGGKLAPEITLALDLLENQSYRGPIYKPFHTLGGLLTAGGQVARYIFGREQPFSVQQARELATHQAARVEQAEAFFGIVPHREARKERPSHFRERY